MTTKAKVCAPWIPGYDYSVFYIKDDKVEILKEDTEWKGWLWCKGKNQKGAWVPSSYLEIFSVTSGKFLKNYSSRELKVQPGEEVFILEKYCGWCLVINSLNESGWVPEKNLT